LWPLIGLAVVGISAGGSGPRPVHVPLVRSDIRPTTTELVGVAAQISGTVAKVLVAPHQQVTGGTLLVELDSTTYRDALARARMRVAAARGRVSVARSSLTVQERAVRAAVRTALVTLPTAQAKGPPVPKRRYPHTDDTALALERARTQLVAAQADVVRAAEARLAATQRTMERDQTLLGQGAISARQLSEDGVVYQSALEQTRSAEASLLRAQEAGLANAGQVSQSQPPGAAIPQAQHAGVAAQDGLQAAQEELAAARQTVDRDKALLAEGAIPAQQVNADTLAYDAARARVAAAGAAVQQAQAQLEAARRERPRTDAASLLAPARRPNVSRAAALVRQAQTTILEAQRAARQLAAAETEVVNAEAAVRDAELDLDRTRIRAPTDGWVTNNPARPGDQVRSGQFLLLLSTPRQAAIRLQQLRRAGQGPGSDRRERLAQIAAEERGALTRLQAESERINVIILGVAGARHIGPVPAFLSDLLRRPVWGEITSGYGWRIHPIFQTPEFHTGIDIAAAWGTPVEAPADGTVIYAGRMPANGMVLILNHRNGFATTYSHLSSYAVRVGEHVRRGQIIARIGSTGWSTGPHLFFEVRENGRPINPLAP
jgi:murein DD-endopeptidase MepM/ murein hydrolase activator NlpD